MEKFHFSEKTWGEDFERMTRLTCNNNVNDVCVSIRIYEHAALSLLWGGEGGREGRQNRTPECIGTLCRL